MEQYQEIICVSRPQHVDEVDEQGYLNANPDVRNAGMGATDHFIKHGKKEGRIQLINQHLVEQKRQQKIEKLIFKTPQTKPRLNTDPCYFLTPEIIDEFKIPDSPAISSHSYGESLVQIIKENPDKLFLDVGAGLRPTYYENVVNTDIFNSLTTDVVCLGEDLPFADNHFDYVLSFAVLEHTKRPWDVAKEMCRVLKKGGTLIVDYPFLQPVHGYPNHFFPATPEGNRILFEESCDIKSLTINPNQHPIHSLYWILKNWESGLSEKEKRKFNKLRIKDILKKEPQDQLNEFYSKNLSVEVQHIIPAGSTLIGIKR